MSVLTVRQVRLRYLVLHGLRWLPVGLLIPVGILLMQERGLSLSRIGLAATAQGLVVLALELPTGGLADALGRKPVLAAAWATCLASLALLAVADSFWLFFLVWALQGVYRALDSGPLESRYVDATLAADPHTEYERGLGQAGTVIGLAIGAGALLSGGLVALGPVGPVSALTLPVLIAYLACYAVHGASNPLHMGLLHRQVDGPYRTSVISLNSMMAQPAGVLTVAAPLYLPAWRAHRRGAAVAGRGRVPTGVAVGAVTVLDGDDDLGPPVPGVAG